MEYVNKNTGEVFKAEELSLNNINGGALNDLFCAELEKLTKELLLRGGYGNVNIAVKVEISADSSDDDVVLLESSVATKYPKQKLGENTSAKISDGGTLVQCQQANMFSEKK